MLDYITRYYIGWAGDCQPTPTGILTARREFSPTLVFDMPIGEFRPSYCQGGNDLQVLVMYADERDVDG